MSNKVIGIEGMVGAGKTSICKELLNYIPNSIFIDGGNIYRGIIEALHRKGINIKELLEKSAKEKMEFNPLSFMKTLEVEFKIENRKTEIYISGEKVSEDKIQSAQNAIDVSKVASEANNSALFAFANNIIESYKKHFNIIVSARELVDIYPNMDCHIFVTATLEERAKRRFNQLGGAISLEEVKKMLIERDFLHEKSGFNKTCKNTIKVDITECKDSKEKAKKVYDECKKAGLI